MVKREKSWLVTYQKLSVGYFGRATGGEGVGISSVSFYEKSFLSDSDTFKFTIYLNFSKRSCSALFCASSALFSSSNLSLYFSKSFSLSSLVRA